jgi:hypothetical protein
VLCQTSRANVRSARSHFIVNLVQDWLALYSVARLPPYLGTPYTLQSFIRDLDSMSKIT